ncbi:tautomerase family protein [Rhizobium sp. ICMP 5592]|uniref:tautomerase family protein n=1 Tax=Rhizobium sp. ICMP 5592 TaxID=2292445 RepID=UPI001296F8EA|nr:tautomerase family protein [Rhizobium sp. ICMP 5592]MQB41991.1 tautomerase family protein [Rhizobium sp. ICMP 5592]
MPFTNISLLRGKSPEYLKALSDNFHRAMVETFDVPPTDRFQAIHQLEPNELIFDRTYLGGPRSDDYVFFHITIGKPRSTEVKKAFYRRLVTLLADAPGVRPEDVMINIITTTREDWSFADGIAQMIEQD